MAAAQKSAVLYHYPCPDGAFAALAAYIYFSHSPAAAAPRFFPNTVYSPLRCQIFVSSHQKFCLFCSMHALMAFVILQN